MPPVISTVLAILFALLVVFLVYDYIYMKLVFKDAINVIKCLYKRIENIAKERDDKK